MRLKGILFGIIGTIAFAASAMAADFPTYTKAVIGSPAYNWTGYYLGAHGGYGFGSTQDVTNTGAARRDLTGGFGGLQTGYNWQFANIVVGVEGDVSFGSIANNWGGTNQFDSYYGKDAQTLFGTVRGRVGLAFDRLLIYGTGGLAWGENDHGFGCDATRVAVTGGCQNKKGGQAFYVKTSPIDVGYVVGGGIEYAVLQNWSVKGEYLYSNYGTNAINMIDPNYPAAKATRNFETSVSTIRGGINYHF